MIHYIVIWPAISMICMTLMMMIAIRLFSNAAVDYEIKREIRKSTDNNRRNLSVVNGKLEIADGFSYQSDNVSFVVLKRNGEILAGEYPENIRSDMENFPIRNNLSSALVCDGATYYVRDARIGRMGGKGLFLRGFLKKSDADSVYRKLEMGSYLMISGMLCVVLFGTLILAKRISKELKNMCQTAEHIGSNLDMSQRMRCEDHMFREIAVLASANNRMLDRLEQTFRLQEQFTSDVAHELRTPVAVVLAQCQYAREKVRDASDYQEVLDAIYRQSKKMNTLITQLLKFSRLDQDRVQMQEEVLDLMEIVQSVCEEQQEKGNDTIAIHLHLHEAVTTGDISLIIIVIQNLVENAIKFSYPDGQVDVETGENSGQAYVRVTDYGIGIEPEKLENIFRRFYKCDQSRNAEGFGLGLPLSLKIAKKHGGRIDVRSTVGKGSEFTLWLPKK